MGRWPCNSKHEHQMSAVDEQPAGSVWHRNQHAAQLRCETCALCLGYWPVKGAMAGKFSQRVHPKHVDLALDELRAGGVPVDHKVVRHKITEIELREQAHHLGQRANRAQSQTKAATVLTPAQMSRKEAKQQMAEEMPSNRPRPTVAPSSPRVTCLLEPGATATPVSGSAPLTRPPTAFVDTRGSSAGAASS